MKKPNPSMSVLVAGLVAGAMAFTLASSVMAQDVGDDAWAEQPPDVRVVVDVSGSMKTNDPNKARRQRAGHVGGPAARGRQCRYLDVRPERR